MAAAATPRGRPQYAALRDEIAPFASGDREPTQPPGSAQRALTARQRNLIQTQNMRLNDFALKARRAHPSGVLLAYRLQTSSTALKLRSPLTKAERTPTKHPTGAPRRRCLPALGIGHPAEKNGLCPPARGAGEDCSARAADVKGETKQKKPQQKPQRGPGGTGDTCVSHGPFGRAPPCQKRPSPRRYSPAYSRSN